MEFIFIYNLLLIYLKRNQSYIQNQTPWVNFILKAVMALIIILPSVVGSTYSTWSKGSTQGLKISKKNISSFLKNLSVKVDIKDIIRDVILRILQEICWEENRRRNIFFIFRVVVWPEMRTRALLQRSQHTIYQTTTTPVLLYLIQ